MPSIDSSLLALGRLNLNENDVITHLCSVAVEKCQDKVERRRAGCGGQAMRKRVLIKNFVAELIKKQSETAMEADMEEELNLEEEEEGEDGEEGTERSVQNVEEEEEREEEDDDEEDELNTSMVVRDSDEEEEGESEEEEEEEGESGDEGESEEEGEDTGSGEEEEDEEREDEMVSSGRQNPLWRISPAQPSSPSLLFSTSPSIPDCSSPIAMQLRDPYEAAGSSSEPSSSIYLPDPLHEYDGGSQLSASSHRLSLTSSDSVTFHHSIYEDYYSTTDSAATGSLPLASQPIGSSTGMTMDENGTNGGLLGNMVLGVHSNSSSYGSLLDESSRVAAEESDELYLALGGHRLHDLKAYSLLEETTSSEHLLEPSSITSTDSHTLRHHHHHTERGGGGENRTESVEGGVVYASLEPLCLSVPPTSPRLITDLDTGFVTPSLSSSPKKRRSDESSSIMLCPLVGDTHHNKRMRL